MVCGLEIGTLPTGTYKLDVDGGPVRIRGDARIDGILIRNNSLTIGNNTTIQGSATIQGNATVTGDLLVNSNKGIVRSQNSTQLKVIRTNVTLTANLFCRWIGR